jgi:G3E family GTPase
VSHDSSAGRPRFFVLTGFLGSGKTTLLSRFLSSPAGAHTAVLINELGEVALDHLLVEKIDQDVSLLPAGCVCCVVSGELDAAIERVLSLGPARIVLETTGIADPAPVLHALATSRLSDRFDFGGVVTTLDASRGAEVIDGQPEGRLQLELADRVVLTKMDLASPESVEGLRASLASYPGLEVREDGERAFEMTASARITAHPHAHAAPHDALTSVIELDSPVDPEALWRCLRMVTMLDGPSLLRIKGIVETRDGHVVLQSAQRALSPLRMLDRAPENWRGSRLVVISRGLSARELEAIATSVRSAAAAKPF